MKRGLKYALCGLAAATAIAATQTKKVARNVMSHHLIDMSQEEILRDLPRILFTKGYYTGVDKGADCVPPNTDLNAIYLGLQENPFPESEHRPTKANIPKGAGVYDPACLLRFTFDEQSIRNTTPDMVQRIAALRPGEILQLKEERSPYYDYYWHYGKGLVDVKGNGRYGLGSFTLSIGYDERGRYLSFYDVWDFSSGKGGQYHKPKNLSDKLATAVLPKLGEPFVFYKRWYFADAGVTDSILDAEWKRRNEEWKRDFGKTYEEMFPLIKPN